MASWQSKVADVIVTFRGDKRTYSSVEQLHAKIAKRSLRPVRYVPPRTVQRAVLMSVRHLAGWPVYRTTPPSSGAAKRVVYVHGGAYTFEIQSWHWRLIRQLTIKVPASCDVPIYPLAPQSTAADTVPAITQIVQAAIDEAGAENVVVAGDSAGGGMALAVAQYLRDRGRRQPSRIVLLSPWLDVTMTDPRQASIEPRDRMLARPGLAEAGRLYAGPLDVQDPLVSPLYGDLRELAPLTVFSGTADIVNADACRLVDKARAAGVEVDYHEAVGMAHFYTLAPISEGRKAQALITRAVRG